MSQISAKDYQATLSGIAHDPRMTEENITAPLGVAAGLSRALLGVGAAGIALTVIGGFVYGAKHAMASYLVGIGVVMAMGLGALILSMAFQLANAGWWITVKRQYENLYSLLPVVLLMLLPVILLDAFVLRGTLWEWLNPEVRAADPLIRAKAVYLNPVRLGLFFVFYLALWGFLSFRLRAYSTEQDRNGDRWLTGQARFMSAWGLPLTALTTAFAGFDYFMSLEPHFFSTMWGVYIFAGGAVSCTAVIIVTFTVLRLFGRMNGLVTQEHYHDLGKYLFAFSCFWAYIGFSQYFLIWYSNIPEETFYMLRRTTGLWKPLGMFLAIGHFIVPFVFLLARRVKRNPTLLTVGALWIIFMHVMDYVWIVRPILHPVAGHGHGGEAPTPISWWLDIAAIVGVMAVFFGLYVGRLASGPLLPLKDPRLPESMSHVNHV